MAVDLSRRHAHLRRRHRQRRRQPGRRRSLPASHVRQRKGHLVITDRYPGFVRHQLVELGYLKSAHCAPRTIRRLQRPAPRRPGRCCIGSSRQFGAEDTAIDAHMLHRMLARAVEYMPGTRRTLRRSAPGPASAPPRPTSCRSSARARATSALYLATGHEGLGITTSLGTGAPAGRPDPRPAVGHPVRALPAVAQAGGSMPDTVTLTRQWRAGHRARRSHGRRGRRPRGRERVPPIGDRRAARPALRHGHLLRMPRDHRRPRPRAAVARSLAPPAWRSEPMNDQTVGPAPGLRHCPLTLNTVHLPSWRRLLSLRSRRFVSAFLAAFDRSSRSA